MERNRMTRQREYGLTEAGSAPRQISLRVPRSKRREDAWDRYADRNTMAPSEDVVENRRLHRRRVAMVSAGNSATRNALRENVIMLLLLVSSIYGLYRLIIYLLNQS